MENEINIAELLRNCPSGMELDSPVWNNIVFKEIDRGNIVILRKSTNSKVYLSQYGEVNSIDGKCVIFPKGKTTWEGFVPPCKFKVGDKVYYDNNVCDVIEILWNSNLNTISYGVYDGKIKNLAIAEELKSYKEETMEGKKLNSNANFLDCSLVDKIELVLGDTHEVVVEDGKTFVVKKGKKYPTFKNLGECKEILGEKDMYQGVSGYKGTLLTNFQRLLIFRDAYWKIAGDWKPDWKNGLNKCCLTVCENRIIKSSLASANAILAFPTEEIRDAFFENFKELIEQCKELL